MAVYAKNLQTSAVPVNSGLVTVLPHDKHRTFLWIDIHLPEDLRLWIGSAPPAAYSEWINIPETGVRFEEGVAGPIYLVEKDGLSLHVPVLSNLTEAPEFVAIQEICVQASLCSNGDQLTSNGDRLIICL